MSIRRVVPDIKSNDLTESRKFYVDFLGFTLGMEMDFIVTFVSPSNPTAQISVMRESGGAAPDPHVTIEVANVDEIHRRAVARGVNIVYPLTDEPWGVRRFFVVDPNGTILNIMSHMPR